MEQLEKVIALSHDPMLVLEKNRIVAMNAAARRLLPGCEPGKSVTGLIPDYILFNRTEEFTATMLLNIRELTVSCAHIEDKLVLSLQPVRSRSRGLLSENLLSGMLDALFNVGLSSGELFRDDAMKPKSREYLAVLRHNYHILARQLSNLSFAYALQEGNLLLQPTETDLVDFCGVLANEVASLTGDGMAALEFSTARPFLTANVDTIKLRRLLLNLLSNSYAHCGSDGHIRLRLSAQGEDAVIAVMDDGCGIPTETLQNVFTRFEKQISGEHPDEVFTGGLGLGIARGIAQLHSGALVIDSAPGKGTNVRVLLPMTQPTVLRDPGVPLKDNHLHVLLTELSGVLDTGAYREEFEPR